MATTHVINAEHLLLALVARRVKPDTRWAAMSDYYWAPHSCRTRFGREPARLVHFRPLMSPMQRGRLHEAIKRQRLTQGLPSIEKTYGIRLRSLLAEPTHIVPAYTEGEEP